MDESRVLERRASWRRGLIACAASLAIHAAALGLLLALFPGQNGSATAAAIAISIQGTEGGAKSAAAGASAAARSATRPLEPSPDSSLSRDTAASAPAAGPEGSAPATDVSEGSTAAASSGSAERGEAALGGGAEDTRGARETGDDRVAELALRVGAAVEERKTYPEAARRRGVEGQVKLKLRVDGQGGLIAAKLAESSGSPLLDRSALDLASSIFPVDNIARREVELTLSINYGLKR